MRSSADEVGDRLVVLIVDHEPRHLLSLVFLLFDFKDVFVEVELERFIRIIYAQLFETVFRQILYQKKIIHVNSYIIIILIVIILIVIISFMPIFFPD